MNSVVIVVRHCERKLGLALLSDRVKATPTITELGCRGVMEPSCIMRLRIAKAIWLGIEDVEIRTNMAQLKRRISALLQPIASDNDTPPHLQPRQNIR